MGREPISHFSERKNNPNPCKKSGTPDVKPSASDIVINSTGAEVWFLFMTSLVMITTKSLTLRKLNLLLKTRIVRRKNERNFCDREWLEAL